MKKLSKDEERELLYECLFCCRRDTFVRQYWRLVGYTIQKLSRLYKVRFSEQDAEDLRHDAFVQLLDDNCRKLWLYKDDGGRTLAGWVAMVVNQTVAAKLRQKGLFSLGESGGTIPLEDAFATEAPADLHFERKEREMLLEDCMKELPPKSRLILKMHYHRDLSFEQIADFLHMSRSAVYTAKFRAMNQLKMAVQKRFEDEKNKRST